MDKGGSICSYKCKRLGWIPEQRVGWTSVALDFQLQEQSPTPQATDIRSQLEQAPAFCGFCHPTIFDKIHTANHRVSISDSYREKGSSEKGFHNFCLSIKSHIWIVMGCGITPFGRSLRLQVTEQTTYCQCVSRASWRTGTRCPGWPGWRAGL